MIAFKVVGKRTRRGSNITIYRNNHPLNERPIDARRLCRENPDHFPKYSKGATITALESTPGIMCFKDRDYAEDFLETYDIRLEAKIIRVRGIGRPRRSLKIFGDCGDNPEYLWTLKEPIRSPIPGTVAFRSVKVLD